MFAIVTRKKAGIKSVVVHKTPSFFCSLKNLNAGGFLLIFFKINTYPEELLQIGNHDNHNAIFCVEGRGMTFFFLIK